MPVMRNAAPASRRITLVTFFYIHKRRRYTTGATHGGMNQAMSFLPVLALRCVSSRLNLTVQAANLPRALLPQQAWAVECRCGCPEHPAKMETAT